MGQAALGAMVWGIICGAAIGCFLYGNLKCATKSKVALYVLAAILAVFAAPVATALTYRMFHDDWGLLGFWFSSARRKPYLRWLY